MNLDYQPSKILILGPSGAGKTTLAARLLSRWRANMFFFWDPQLEWSRKFGGAPSATLADMSLALASGVVFFDPGYLFPGRFAQAFDFFCNWSYKQAQAFHGPKVFVADEVQAYTKPGPGGIPPGLSLILDMGRRYELDCVFCSHAPNRVHDEIRNQVTAICAFRFTDPLQVRWLAEMGFNGPEVRALRDHAFVRFDCRQGQARASAGVK